MKVAILITECCESRSARACSKRPTSFVPTIKQFLSTRRTTQKPFYRVALRLRLSCAFSQSQQLKLLNSIRRERRRHETDCHGTAHRTPQVCTRNTNRLICQPTTHAAHPTWFRPPSISPSPTAAVVIVMIPSGLQKSHPDRYLRGFFSFSRNFSGMSTFCTKNWKL